MITKYIKNIIVGCLFIVLPLTSLLASSGESYIQTLSGKIKKGDSCIVIDDKFINMPLSDWNQLHNLSVENIISFEIRQDTSIYYQTKPFSCILNVSIKYFSSRDQDKPTEIDSVKLTVNYDTARNKSFHALDKYQFKNAYKVIVVVNSITSKEWGTKIPAIFRLKNQILIDRKYPFTPSPKNSVPIHLKQQTAFDNINNSSYINGQMQPVSIQNFPEEVFTLYPVYTSLQNNGSQLQIMWDPSNFSGGQDEYDIEWTYIDAQSVRGTWITTNGINSIQQSDAELWMNNDNTRVTIKNDNINYNYSINLPYLDGYVLVRMRAVEYVTGKMGTQLRHPSEWQYTDGTNMNCVHIDAQTPGLNWQYTSEFAEDGKRKEVITYFDGSLRGRQSVTITNSKNSSPDVTNNVAVVGETIYDNMGRPAMTILPSPVMDQLLGFHPGINQSPDGSPYSHTDIMPDPNNSCSIIANLLYGSGAGLYFSAGNQFMNSGGFADNNYNKYVPDGGQKPFSLLQYTPDNTGRIRAQSGVGPALQIGTGHETRFYYGKPLQDELDRLFGMEVGNASHYLKNMVVDPNNQVNISYVDANGKTIATSLAGAGAQNMDALPTANSTTLNYLEQTLVKPADFSVDAANLVKQTTATFLVETPGEYKVNYTVNPAALTTTPAASAAFCSNCYYELVVEVKDDCGDVMGTPVTSGIFTLNNTTCGSNSPLTGTITFNTSVLGEYTVTYSLRLSKDDIQYQEDYYIDHNTDLKNLQAFVAEQLAQADLSGCYNECSTCIEKLGSEDDFTQHVNDQLNALKATYVTGIGPAVFDVNDANIKAWIHTTYTTLYNACQAMQSNCPAESPCEQKLDMMKADVVPGGQYALYSTTFDATTQLPTYAYLERDISVLRFYNDASFPDITFTADDGTTKHINQLSESDFIAAYLNHPEWADEFVKEHPEYCSYLWCTSNTAVTDVYKFEEKLRDVVVSGDDAVAKGLYSWSDFDNTLLINSDPLFTELLTGAQLQTYKTAFKHDLNNLSEIMHMSDGGVNLEIKDIHALVDWEIYCMSTDPNNTTDTWNSICSISPDCRSVNLEWQLYKNYYLQLRSKYVAALQALANPSCTNCFIGEDAFSGTTNSLSSCVNSAGATTVSVDDFPCPVPSQFDAEIVPINDLTAANCGTGANYQLVITYPNFTENDPMLPFPNYPDQEVITVHVFMQNIDHNQPSLTFDLPIDNTTNGSTFYCLYDFDPSNYEAPIITSVTCKKINPQQIIVPASTCHDDPKYASYSNKIRIFNDYTNTDAILACNSNNPPNLNDISDAEAQSLDALRTNAVNNLNLLKDSWTNTLRNVITEENANALQSTPVKPVPFPGLDDVPDPVNGGVMANPTVTQIINALYNVAKKYIDIAPQDDIRPASTLPSGVVSDDGYASFKAVFTAIVPSVTANGLNENLLNGVFPYDVTSFLANPNVTQANATVCSNLADLYATYVASGSTQLFNDYLKKLLGNDYILTSDELTDLQQKCSPTSTCNPKILKDALLLPIALAAPANERWLDCSIISADMSDFTSRCSNVQVNSKLYQVLLTNYFNTKHGFALTFDEYNDYKNSCPSTTVFLYNRAQSPIVQQDDFDCASGVITNGFLAGGQLFDTYIDQQRQLFRNRLVSACMGNQASATVSGYVWEYNYTLFYYDQSGNLVKTIPPEGVHQLTQDQVKQVQSIRDQGTVQCDVSGIPITEDVAGTLSGVSNFLQNGSAKSIELWMNGTGTTRQVRFVTPDNQYMYQAAISDNKLWVELYTLSQGYDANHNPDGSVDITLSNQAYADLSGKVFLQNWTHLVVQPASPTGSLTGGDNLQLFIDGISLNTITTGASMPPYPFDWEITANSAGNYPGVPANDLAVLKHLRVYRTIASAGEIMADYENACLSPVGRLTNWYYTNSGDAQDFPLEVWGRFNIPNMCTAGTTLTRMPIDNNSSLSVTANPNQSSNWLPSISNNFTMEFWAKPGGANTVSSESQQDNTPGDAIGISGQQYAIYPTFQSSPNAGAGVAVGTNSICVFEHSDAYLAPVLVWAPDQPITDWTHIAVVYTNKQPALYVNGNLVKTGLTSQQTAVYPSYGFGGGQYGFYKGNLDEVRIWSTSRTAWEIQNNYNQPVDVNTAGLAGYWPMSSSDGNTIKDITCNNRSFSLTTGTESWQAINNAPVSDYAYAETVTGRFIVPDHSLPTNYAYNSFNLAVQATTPDEGLSQSWYDRTGRPCITQNAVQLDPADNINQPNRYSYKRYDALGRIIEVGEKLNAASMDENTARHDNLLQSWLSTGNNTQITLTAYDDVPSWANPTIVGAQTNLRKRISSTLVVSDGSHITTGSFYSYDYEGNVSKLVLQNTALMNVEAAHVTGSTGLKKIEYEYDLISHKTNKVKYQDGKWDQYYYQYLYDGDNRLTDVYSGRENSHSYPATDKLTQEAHYSYYLHGPLARVQIGQSGVQGLDYAYTLQGWLKGVNSQFLDPFRDINNDGGIGTHYGSVGRDVLGYSLGYYNGDYAAIGIPYNNAFSKPFSADPQSAGTSGMDLFNGNISTSTYAILNIENGTTIGNTYRYDYLNRLTGMDRHGALSIDDNPWDNTSIIDAYKERVGYDGNGNIVSYLRNGAPNAVNMDNLSYVYNVDNLGRLVNNKLRNISDGMTVPTGQGDITTQPLDNYRYDKIGNLLRDQTGGLNGGDIQWTMYGKISHIAKTDGSTIDYEYDASGNRITKAVGSSFVTYYVRDDKGNVLGVYGLNGSTFSWNEQHLYGNSRLGMLTPHFNIGLTPLGSDAYKGSDHTEDIGNRLYELTNHLGNVMVTIDDRLIPYDDGNNGTIDWYNANIISAQDYYPFGMLQPGRQYSIGSDYRYGFNGKENDRDINTGAEDYGMRIYDGRVGRFLSVDPLSSKYPELTPYQFAGDKPISFIDLDGAEPKRSSKPGEVATGTNPGEEQSRTWVGDGNGGWRLGYDDLTVTGRTKRYSGTAIPQDFYKKKQRYMWMFEQEAINGRNPLNADFGDEYRQFVGMYLNNYITYTRAQMESRSFQIFMLAYMSAPLAVYGGMSAAVALSSSTAVTTGLRVTGNALRVGGKWALKNLVLSSAKYSVATRVSLSLTDAAIQLAEEGKINPLQTLGAQFGPLTYAITAATDFDWSKMKFGWDPMASYKTVLVSTVFNFAGGKMGDVMVDGGFGAAAGPVTVLPAVVGDYINAWQTHSDDFMHPHNVLP